VAILPHPCHSGCYLGWLLSRQYRTLLAKGNRRSPRIAIFKTYHSTQIKYLITDWRAPNAKHCNR